MRTPFGEPRNAGIAEVPGLLRQLKARGYDVEFVDTAEGSEKDRSDFYLGATGPSVFKHYEVKRMFGTNRRSACWFGAEVPALIVTGADLAGDTYPHKKGNRITTIHDYLTKLLATRAD